MTNVTESERIVVSCTSDGATWYVYHRDYTPKPNYPIRCSFDKLSETIKMVAIKVGKIENGKA